MPPARDAGVDRLFSLALDLLCVIGPDDHFKRVNPAFEHTLGWSADELLSRPLIEFVHPEDRARSLARLAEVRRDPTHEFENRYLHKDGSVRWLAWRTSPRDEHGYLYAVARDVSEKRRRDERARFEATLLDAVGQAVIATDPDGAITYWNRDAEQLYGWRADEVMGRGILDVTPSEPSQEQAAAILASLRAGKSWSGEFPVRRRDGTVIPAHVTDAPVLDESGALIGIVGISTDVSERRRAEATLRESEERFRTLSVSSPLGIFQTDPMGGVTYVNPRFVQLWEVASEADLLGQRWLDRVQPEDRDGFVQGWTAALARRVPYEQEYRILLPDGRVRRLHGLATPLLDGAGALVGTVGTVEDVTERRRAEEELRRQALTFETITDAVVVADVAGNVVDWNPAAERIFGYTRREMLGRSAEAFYPPEVAAEQHASIAESLASRGRWVGELRFRRKDGSEGVCETSIVVLRGADGQPVGGIGVNRDVTDRHRAQEALRRSEERYRQLVETSHEGICTVDARGAITYANSRLAGLLGYDVSDLTGRSFFELMHPADEFAARTRFARRFRGISEAEDVRFRRRDGTILWVRKSVSPIAEQGAEGVAMYVLGDITERHAAEQRLAESERLFRALTEQSSELVSVLDAHGTIRYANPAYERLLGIDPDAALGLPGFDFVHPDDVAELSETFAMLAREPGAIVTAEYRARHRDGSWRTLRSIARNLLADPAVDGIVVNSHDVTERRQAEDAVRASQARYERIAANVPGMVYQFVLAPDGTASFPFVSEGVGAVFGVNPQRILEDAQMALDAVHPDDRASFHATNAQSAATLAPWKWAGRVLLPSGEERWIEGASRPERQPDGGTLWDGVLLDVTERRRSDELTRRQNEMLQSIFDHIPAFVTLTRHDGAPILANREWTRVTGWDLAGIADADLFSELYPDAQERARVREFMRAATGKWGEFRLRSRDGRVLDTVWANVVLSDGSVLGLGQDVTERLRLEQQFRQAQKMEAVGRLAGGIAHDFNNMLSVIASYSGMVLADLDDDAPARPDLLEIQRAVDRAAALTRQLLAFSRQQVLQPRVMDLCEVIAGAERMLERMIGDDVVLVTRFDRRPALVRADPGQIEQMLMNLAVNARDAMPAGGIITIEVDPEGADVARLSRPGDGAPDAYVLLRVTDTGSGMDEETRGRIFEPFFTTKRPGQGTGLGLATVYGIVTQSGGSIAVESAPGEGTTFSILLPRTLDPVDHAAREAPAPVNEPHRGATVLLVEDESALRAAARRQLEKQGYRVLDAGDGLEALAIVDRHHAEVDLVVSDVVMPHLSGRELLDRLQSRLGDLPVLFMSGYSIEAVERHGVLREGASLLRKPFTPQEFLAAVSAALTGQPPRRGSGGVA